jgi:hypothetical protein
VNGPPLATLQLGEVASADYRNPSAVAGTFTEPVAVVAGEPYLLVLSVPSANTSHHYRWSVDTSDPYREGMVQVGTKLYRYHDALARIAY